MEVALKHWGKVEPEAAVAFAEGRFGMDRTYFLNWVVAGWVSAAPAGAKDWLTGHKDFPYLDVHGSIVLNAVGRMAEFDPHVAWVFWSDLPGTLKQGNFWRIIRPTVGTEVFTDVVAEIMDLPLGSGRKQALHNTARATGQYAWDAGLAILERLDAGEQKRFAETMVTGASHESISEALRLVDRLPQNTQEAAYEAALKRLATQGNPNDFATWLNEQSPDPALDGPISEFALHLNRMDPESAIAWADTISTGDVWYTTLDQIFRKWSNSDSDSVALWIGMLESAEDRALISANLANHRISEISALVREHLDEAQLDQVDLGDFKDIAAQRQWISDVSGVSIDGIILGRDQLSLRLETKYGRSFEFRF